jgi:alanyl-tRNA synthetase
MTEDYDLHVELCRRYDYRIPCSPYESPQPPSPNSLTPIHPPQAIEWAWSCLIDVYGLDPSRLYATYFGGNSQTPADTEARDLWLKYLPPNRVLPFDAKDNFWEMGATGPCGPCVEIHYDRIGNRDAGELVNADLPDVIEIWNNVFIQYNREADGSLRKLPAQHVDTGMGFERLTSILQGKDSNYDTDIFTPIFEAIRLLTGARPYAGKVGADDSDYVDMAYRVVADHVRTLTFAITDGAVPSNDGRGYVLRRVLRRAVRYGRQNLGAKLGFFSKLVPTLVEHMGEAFPEIVRKKEFVIQVIKEEEESFSRTLDKGLSKFSEMAENAEGGKFKGEDAHFLYTSMGFPMDLTELMCEEKNLKLDVEGFERKMAEEKELSAAARKAKMSGGSGKEMVLEAEQTASLISREVETTKDEEKYVWEKNLVTTVKACFIGRNETEDKTGFKDTISKSDGAAGLILQATNFYAEQGGQIYDTGFIKSPTGTLRVDNVQVYGGYVLHVGSVISGTFTCGSSATCEVDYERRRPVASNHTMTHVLNFALRDVLIGKEVKTEGPSIDQKGSLVDDEKLR